MAIGANRSIIVARYAMEDDGLKVAVLTEHIETMDSACVFTRDQLLANISLYWFTGRRTS
jgi:hypothetical protein